MSALVKVRRGGLGSRARGEQLRPIAGLPDGDRGFQVVGEVTADDYEKTLLPDLDASEGATAVRAGAGVHRM
ncbi:hypothetical protein GCM10009560_76230 [Nonomuraea longicatena]|uniref:Uncharacterized protein n=1 Tax=Nonomuraea longicatena TaxID=83682 RepID=A0ABN1R8J0_9ACTN